MSRTLYMFCFSLFSYIFSSLLNIVIRISKGWVSKLLLYEKVHEEIARRTTALQTMQQRDGTWRFCFEGAPLTDCHMIFLLKLLGRDKEIEPFVKRLASLQTNEGTWKLYEDEVGGIYLLQFNLMQPC